MKIHTIEEALLDIANGKMVIVVDDEQRENEGDIVLAAEFVTPELINKMIKMSSGLICVPVSPALSEKLELAPMIRENTAKFGVNFSFSIDAAHGITTGASVYDKAVTIKTMTLPDANAKMFVRPGHIFPLIAKKGGVLERPGHTEAAVDLVRLAGLSSLAIISEITNEDGSMARLAQLFNIAQKLDLKIVSIEDLIKYRYMHEKIVREIESVHLPTDYGNFRLHVFENELDHSISFAQVKGNYKNSIVPVRIHSECFTGDVLGSIRCDCGKQLDMAMSYLQKKECGILIYLKQEGRGIGLKNKIKAYKLQDDEGCDTIQANHKLGFADDLRHYAIASQILKHYGITDIELLTNNPNKIADLLFYGINITKRIPLEIPWQESNEKYLLTKKQKMNHLFSNF